MRKERRVHPYIGMIIAIVLAVVGGFTLIRYFELREPVEEIRGDLSVRFKDIRTVEYQGKTYIAKSRMTSILFIGIDHTTEDIAAIQDYRNGGQADYLLLMVIDEEGKTITPIQIDRDTMAQITVLGVLGNVSGTKTAQISLSHGFGDGREQSCDYTVEAVSHLLLGEPIDYYIALNMDAISLLNDALGGVTVTLSDDLSKSDPAMVKGATITLTGKQAETFVRSRMNVGDGTNAGRMARQQVYMDAAGNMLSTKVSQSAEFIGRLFDQLKPYLITDMTRGRMINEAWNTRTYEHMDTVKLEGTHRIGADGFMEFHPNEKSIEALILGLYYELVE